MGLARQFGKILGSAPRVAAGGLVEIAPKDETLGIARRRIGDQQVELLDGRVLGVPIVRLEIGDRLICLGVRVRIAQIAAVSERRAAERYKALREVPGHLNRNYCSGTRSEETTSELQTIMRNSYAVCCLKNKTQIIRRLTR